jgi:hypothetical protein
MRVAPANASCAARGVENDAAGQNLVQSWITLWRADLQSPEPQQRATEIFEPWKFCFRFLQPLGQKVGLFGI